MKSDKWGGSSSSSDLTEESTDISVRFSRGLEHLRNAEVDKAKHVFDDIIGEDPEYAPAFFGLSCVHIRLDVRELARKFIERSLELDPSYGEAHLVMARLLYEDGDFVGGYEHVNKAVKFGVSPDSGNELIDSLLQSRPKEENEKGGPDIREHEITSPIKTIRGKAPANEFLFILASKFKPLTSYLPESLRGDVYLLGCFFLALAIRLLVFALIPIDWKSVSYHLWQVGYLTLHKGLANGRMWDLHGVEYLYPILPSLLQSILMWIFRTSSNIPFRILNVVLGGFNSIIVYKIGLKYYDRKVGVYAAFFTAFFPGIIIWNLLNLYETIAAFFFLMCIYTFDTHLYYSGVVLALSANCRTEYWPISVGILCILLIFERDNKTEKFIPFFTGWLTIMAPISFFYFIRTGNWLYPIYYGLWGGFGFNVDLLQLIISKWYIVLIGIGVFYYFYSKKNDKYLIYLSFLGFLGFHLLEFGFSSSSIFGALIYTDHDASLFPLTSKYYLIDIILGSIVMFGLLRKINNQKFYKIISYLLVIISISSLFIVIPKVQLRQDPIRNKIEYAKIILNYWHEEGGGTLICDDVALNYALSNVRNKLPPKYLMSSFYSPFYYGIEDIESVRSWLHNNNVTIFVYTGKKGSKLVFDLITEKEPALLVKLHDNIYRVNYS